MLELMLGLGFALHVELGLGLGLGLGSGVSEFPPARSVPLRELIPGMPTD